MTVASPLPGTHSLPIWPLRAENWDRVRLKVQWSLKRHWDTRKDRIYFHLILLKRHLFILESLYIYREAAAVEFPVWLGGFPVGISLCRVTFAVCASWSPKLRSSLESTLDCAPVARSMQGAG